MSGTKLFREEVFQHNAHKSLGGVTIIQPLAFKLLTLLLLVIVSLALSYLWIGEYARKHTVNGYLEPNVGVANVYPRRDGGVVSAIFVEEGSYVAKGASLLHIGFPNQGESGKDSNENILAELFEQRGRLVLQKNKDERFYADQKAFLEQRVVDSMAEANQQKQLLQLQRQRLNVSLKQQTIMKKAHENGAVSESQWMQNQASSIDQRKEYLIAANQLLQLESNARSVAHSLKQLPFEHEDKKLQIDLQLSEVEQKISQLEGSLSNVLVAPVAGYVTAIQTVVGSRVSLGIPVLAILPDDYELGVVLLLPSSARGFVEIGQAIRLTVDAFPHQQFGTKEAIMTSLSTVPVSAAELKSPIPAAGPVFVARARLAEASIFAFGTEHKLQPGMLVRADIILERRSLLDWLLEPFYSLRGRSS